MTIKIKLLGAISFIAASLLSLNTAQACSDYNTLADEIAAPGMITKTAVATGNYSVASTWSNNSVPTVNDVVLIPPGITVTVNNNSAVAKTILVSGSVTTTGSGKNTQIATTSVGTLKFLTNGDSKLRVETLLVGDYGRLLIGGYNVGTEGGPIAATATAKIVITGTNPVTDSQIMARGIITDCDAIIRMNGAAPRAPFAEFQNSLDPNNSSGNLALTSNFAPTNWQPGDEVVIPSTVFTREYTAAMEAGQTAATGNVAGTVAMQNEIRTLQTVNSGGLTLSAPLTYSHTRADSASSRVHVNVANLTRNIIIQTDPNNVVPHSAGYLNYMAALPARGHVMFMGGDAKITGVCFQDLGRTNKREVVGDPLLTNPWNAPILNLSGGYNPIYIPSGTGNLLDPTANPRKRYAMHFHENIESFIENNQQFPLIYHTAPKAIVNNCVMRGTPGWGFVNHSSWVDFKNNVAFDFQGAGFAFEDGDEIGVCSDNISIGGLGNGEFPLTQTVSTNYQRMAQGDMGYTGEGYWTQGPDVKFINDIAAGCKGCGFFIWGSGHLDPSATAVDAATGQTYYGIFTGRPLGRDGLGVPPASYTAQIGDSSSANPNAAGTRAPEWNYTIEPFGTSIAGSGAPGTAVRMSGVPPQDYTNDTAYGCFYGWKSRFTNSGSKALFHVRDNDYSRQWVDSTNGKPQGKFNIATCTFWNNLNGMHASYSENIQLTDIYIVAQKPIRTGAVTPATGAGDAGLGDIGLTITQATNGTLVTAPGTVTINRYTRPAQTDPANLSRVNSINSGPDGSNPNVPVYPDFFHEGSGSNGVPDYNKN